MQINSYKTLPLGKYLTICEISKDDTIEDIDKQVKIVAILNDLEENAVLDMPINEFTELVKGTLFLREPSKEDHTRIADSYVLGKFELIPVKDFTKITTSQYIDFQTLAKQGDKYLVELLACLLVPKGKKYGNDYYISEVCDAIRENLSIADTLSLCAFFFKLWKGSIQDSLTYSRGLAKKIKNKEQREQKLKNLKDLEDLMSNGDGMQM